MSNKEIRQQAWEICRRNFCSLLMAMFLISLILEIPSLLSDFPFPLPAIGSLATIILVPILRIGSLQYAANLWHGEHAGPGTLFQHAKKILRLWGIALIVGSTFIGLFIAGTVCYPLTGLVTYFLSGTLEITLATLVGDVLALVVVITAAVAIIYLMTRMSLAYPALVLDRDRTAIECLKISFKASKGRIRRLFCNSLILSLPLIAMGTMRLTMVLATMFFGQRTSVLVDILIDLIFALFEALFTGYIALGEYGLAEQLLTHRTPEQNALPSADSL